MICMKTGLPHVGETCAACARVDEIARRTREDPRISAKQADVALKWREREEGRCLDLKAWCKLDEAWRRLSDEERDLFARVWAEKAEEYDRDPSKNPTLI